MVSPDGAGVYSFCPRSQSTGVRSAGENPWHVFGIAVRVFGKRQTDFVGEVGQIVDGVLESQILEVLSGQVGERCGCAPVAVLQDNGGSSDLLSDNSSGAVGAEIAGIASCVDFTGCEEDNWGA
jgi:hypothetical protein